MYHEPRRPLAPRVEGECPSEPAAPHRELLEPLFGWDLEVRAAKAIVRRLIEDGWVEAKGRGSHRNFRHPTKPGKVTVPFHGNRDLPIGTIRGIERLSGLELLPRM